MPIYKEQKPIIVHLPPQANDVILITGHVDNKLVLSIAPVIPNFVYENTQLNHIQLGAEISFIFEDDKEIDKFISALDELKQVYNALKAG